LQRQCQNAAPHLLLVIAMLIEALPAIAMTAVVSRGGTGVQLASQAKLVRAGGIMTRTLRSGAFAVTITAMVFAPLLSARSQQMAGTVTVTGCVERSTTPRADGTGTTAVGTTGGLGPDTKYLLSGVTQQTASGGPGNSRESGVLADSRTYRLDGSDESKVSDHVGHTVQITGTLEEQGRSEVGTSGRSLATADMVAPKLKVGSIRMLSGSCAKK
jgi:hypothetical protein